MGKKRKNRKRADRKREDNKRATTGDAGGAAADTRDADQDPDQGTGGKVIDRGESRLVIKGNGNVQGGDGQPRKLSVQPRVVEPVKPDLRGVVEAREEEVVKLQRSGKPGGDRVKPEKAKLDKLGKAPRREERQEEGWGKEMGVGWWLLIAGLCALALLVGGMALKHFHDGELADSVETRDTELVPLGPQDDPYEGSPQKWFHENMTANKKQAVSLLRRYLAAGTSRERSSLVRNPDDFLKRVDAWPHKFRPRAVDDEHCTWSVSDNQGRAYLLLRGLDADFMPMRACFVRDDATGKIVLDWQASVGWSETPMDAMKQRLTRRQAVIDQARLDYEAAVRKAELARKAYGKKLAEYRRQVEAWKNATAEYVVKNGDTLGKIAASLGVSVSDLVKANSLASTAINIGQRLKIPAHPGQSENLPAPEPPREPAAGPARPPELPAQPYTQPVALRCLLSRRNEHYLGPYNERQHSAFMLSSPDRQTYVWAYVPRDSQLDLRLRRLLDHGRFVVDLKKDLRVTVRVKRSAKDALPSQLELVELLHPDWVAP